MLAVRVQFHSINDAAAKAEVGALIDRLGIFGERDFAGFRPDRGRWSLAAESTLPATGFSPARPVRNIWSAGALASLAMPACLALDRGDASCAPAPMGCDHRSG